MIDPSTRDVSDVKHIVTAAASSSSKERAKKFLEECGCPSEAKAYGSYEELVRDDNIDVIYIATPHSHHYQNAMLSLEAGKHVLCEKAFTVNAAQARKLAETARAKNLFLMEAVWTRWFPLSIQIRKTIADGILGPIHRVIADLSFGEDVEKTWGTTDRMVNMDLAGGAMLDCMCTFPDKTPRTFPRHQLIESAHSGNLPHHLAVSMYLSSGPGRPPQTAYGRLLHIQIRSNWC